jgi:hypothetical protein
MKTNFSQRYIAGVTIVVLCSIGIHSPLNAPAQAETTPPPDNTATAGALPSNIHPTSPLAQVVRLTQAGVDTNVIMTYVVNSGSTFNLDSDKIIYLKDVGLPNEIVTAMMQRDQQLQQEMAANTYQPPVQPATSTEPPETESPAQPAQPAEVTVNYFYDTLTPYGAWMDVEGYGRCWRPSVVVYNSGWQPYCDHGHWVYTDCGWYWASDYSWGWAPFHYGRWFRHARWGWCWAPDTVWGPSWVTWRYSTGYCGWAPLPPFAEYRSGIGFFYQGRNVSFGFDFGLGADCFTFVQTRDFCDPHPRRHRLPPAQAPHVFSQTTVINNFNGHGRELANRGIDPEHITTVTRTPIIPVSLRDTTAPGGRGMHRDQPGRDGHTLIVNRPHFVDHPAPGENRNNRPTQWGSPGQIHSPQPDNIRPTPPNLRTRQLQTPHTDMRNPQNRNESPAAGPLPRPTPPANFSAPVHDNRSLTPKGREQQPLETPRSNWRKPETPAASTPSPNPWQHNVSDTPRRSAAPSPGPVQHSAPVVAPVERPQRNTPPPSPPPSSPPRSSGRDQDKGDSGNGRGPRH